MKGPVTGDQLEIATQAARWGADLELDACCGVLRDKAYLCGEGMLRAARRPKPPSLNEQALKQLDCVEDFLRNQGVINTDPFRRALENLPND